MIFFFFILRKIGLNFPLVKEAFFICCCCLFTTQFHMGGVLWWWNSPCIYLFMSLPFYAFTLYDPVFWEYMCYTVQKPQFILKRYKYEHYLLKLYDTQMFFKKKWDFEIEQLNVLKSSYCYLRKESKDLYWDWVLSACQCWSTAFH